LRRWAIRYVSRQRCASAAAAHSLAGRRRLHALVGRSIEAENFLIMTQAVAAVLADALRLDEEARAELAVELLASLDGPADADAGTQWTAEIERRVAAIEAGTATIEPWDEVRRRIERDVLGR
jgi:putative addiction module component (TIGR02574 family)